MKSQRSGLAVVVAAVVTGITGQQIIPRMQANPGAQRLVTH